MKQAMLNWRTWLIALIVLAFVAVSYVNSANQPQEYPPYVSHSPSPTGTKAFYTYLEEAYSQVERWGNEPSLLPADDGGRLLIMVEPHFVPGEDEMAAYHEFMEAGNTILLFSETAPDLFGVNGEDQFFPDDTEGTVETDEGEYEADTDTVVRFLDEDDDDILITDDSGVKALKRQTGEGALIVSDSPDWLMNGMILDHDHVPLLLGLIEEGVQDGPILFDDYIHGGEPGAATLYPQWFLTLLFQGGLLTLLWLWLKGKRFGPVFEPREATVRFSDESIQALAAWYLRLKGRKYDESLRIQADYVRMLMQEKWGIPYRQDWTDTADGLERHWPGASKQDIEAFLSGLTTALRQTDMAKKDYLYWSNKIDELRKEVEER